MYKKDIKLFLILIPLINGLNYYLTYPSISFSWFNAVTFIIDTLQGYLAWFAVRVVIRLLDKKLSFSPNPFLRIITQIFSTTAIGLIVIIGLTLIENSLFSSKPIPPSFYSKDIFIFLIWFFVVNGIYIGWHYFSLWQISEHLHQERDELLNRHKLIKAEGFTIKLGKQTHIVLYSRIAGFLIENECAFIYTIDNEKYILDNSLDKIEKVLPPEFFFRINRQVLVHRQIISSYKRMDNGKVDVYFKPLPSFPTTAQLSRTKAPEFKIWINVVSNNLSNSI